MKKSDFVTIRIWNSDYSSLMLGHATMELYSDEGLLIDFRPENGQISYLGGMLSVTKFEEEKEPDYVISIPVGEEVIEQIKERYSLFMLSNPCWSAVPNAKNYVNDVFRFFVNIEKTNFASSTSLVASLLFSSLDEEIGSKIIPPGNIESSASALIEKLKSASKRIVPILIKKYLKMLILKKIKEKSTSFYILAKYSMGEKSFHKSDEGKLPQLVKELNSYKEIVQKISEELSELDVSLLDLKFKEELSNLSKTVQDIKLDIEVESTEYNLTQEQKDELASKLETISETIKQIDALCVNVISYLEKYPELMEVVNCGLNLLKSCAVVTAHDIVVFSEKLFELSLLDSKDIDISNYIVEYKLPSNIRPTTDSSELSSVRMKK